MRIHADPTTDGTGIALDVDDGELIAFTSDFTPRPAVLTIAEAVELRDELTQAIDKIAPKTRTPDDVHDRPQPGDELRWSDGEIWRVIESDGHRVRFLMTGDQRRGESSLQLRAWAMRNDPACAHTFVCIPASDVPPPTT